METEWVIWFILTYYWIGLATVYLFELNEDEDPMALIVVWPLIYFIGISLLTPLFFFKILPKAVGKRS